MDPMRSDDRRSDACWLAPEDAGKYVGLSASHLAKLRLEGNGPKYARAGSRAIRYSRQELDRWMTSRTHTSTAEYPSPKWKRPIGRPATRRGPGG